MNKEYENYIGDDLDFYEQFVLKQPKEEQLQFLKEHPDFLKDYPVNPMRDGRMHLLEDKMYRGIMRKIKLLDCEM